MNKNEKIMTVRPESIIEARFSLSNKQNSIVDMVLSKIKDDDNLRYTLDIKEYESLIKTDTSNIYRDFKKAVKTFENKGFTIVDEDNPDGVWFSWFSKIKYRDSEGKIDVNVDIDFKKILYEVKKKIFYDMSYTLNMKSNYSQRLYYYMKSFEDTGWRIDILDELAEKLEAPESYKNFANMKKYVLDKAKAEVNDITDIEFYYIPIKTGRKVTHIKSIIKSKNKNIINYKIMSVEYILKTIGDLIDGEEDAKKILNAINVAIQNKHTEESDIINYFKNQVDNAIEYHKTRKNIPLVALIINAIKQNWKKKQVKDQNQNEPKQLKFNNFEPRQYDYKALEYKLLGWDKDDEVAIDTDEEE